jgi:hypothetical protein
MTNIYTFSIVNKNISIIYIFFTPCRKLRRGIITQERKLIADGMKSLAPPAIQGNPPEIPDIYFS